MGHSVIIELINNDLLVYFNNPHMVTLYNKMFTYSCFCAETVFFFLKTKIDRKIEEDFALLSGINYLGSDMQKGFILQPEILKTTHF